MDQNTQSKNRAALVMDLIDLTPLQKERAGSPHEPTPGWWEDASVGVKPAVCQQRPRTDHELLREAVCQMLSFSHWAKQRPLQNTPGKLPNHSPRPDFFSAPSAKAFYMSQQLRPQEEHLQGLNRTSGPPSQVPGLVKQVKQMAEAAPSGLTAKRQPSASWEALPLHEEK